MKSAVDAIVLATVELSSIFDVKRAKVRRNPEHVENPAKWQKSGVDDFGNFIVGV
jgi:hypothetical protein